ncbi:MAG: protein-disulfide reductase DsbD family protein [Candidatus Bipolaricaulota bacterium]|nr:protein-disulfide reductase DsbD family protein [Candidatus Bipolaricaulota bacterium]MCX7843784.1 protein-disulfide reductase DsbD family protein [Candidatus Bipolaricaulota bacterium]MDW8151366.1 cytochrome c biogenesis protein CcdA [Candidatus Bipolaricaulota bacterium]
MRVLALALLGVWAWAQVPTALVRVEVVPPAPVRPGGEAVAQVRIDIAPGWHIHAHAPSQAFLIPTRLEWDWPEGFTGEERWPAPEIRRLRFSQAPLELYEGVIAVELRIRAGAGVAPATYRIRGRLRYQACSDEVCVPPASVEVELPVEVVPGGAAPPGPGAGFARGFLWALGAAFLVGLGLNLTPCVYPMVPVTVAYFAKVAGQRVLGTLGLALAYLLGLALTYSALGALAALGGGLLGMALQHPAVLAFLAAVMVALALSFFGVYTLRAPAALLRRLPRAQAGPWGAFLMGAVVGLVAAPCVGPATVAFLSYVASLGDPLKGFVLFFALALGLGLPYVGLALLSGKLRRLPRAGPWTVWVEHLLGFLLLGMALYFLSPLLPELGLRVGIGLLAGGGGLFLLASGLRRRSRVVAVLSALVAAAGLGVGVRWGLPARRAPEIPWVPYSAAALAQAQERGTPVLLYFSAEWCIPCKELAATTFRDAQVHRELAAWTPVKVDLTEVSPEEEALRRRFGVVGVPTLIFLGPQGEERGRLFGYVDARGFLAALQRAYPRPG